MSRRWTALMDRLRKIDERYVERGEQIAQYLSEQQGYCCREWLARIVDDPRLGIPPPVNSRDMQRDMQARSWVHVVREALREAQP